MVISYLALIGRIILLGYEKVVVRKLGKGKQSEGATFLYQFLACPFLLPFILFATFPSDLGFLKYAALSSLFYSFAFTLALKSLSTEETSLVSPLYHFNIFFLLILSVIFLGESFTVYKLIGMVLLIYGSSYLAKKKKLFDSFKTLFSNRGVLMMTVCSFLMAIGRVIDGFATRSVSPVIYALTIYLIISIYILIYLIIRRKASSIVKIFKDRTKPALISGFLNAFTYLFLLFAIQKIEVSVAEPVSMLSLVVTLILAKFMFNEKILSRMVGVIFMIIGAWLLFV